MDEPADPTRLSQLGHSATEAGRPASQASAAANDIRVSGADLLDRIERQSEELARTQVRVEQLESAGKAPWAPTRDSLPKCVPETSADPSRLTGPGTALDPVPSSEWAFGLRAQVADRVTARESVVVLLPAGAVRPLAR